MDYLEENSNQNISDELELEVCTKLAKQNINKE